jgi:hypothetical protein
MAKVILFEHPNLRGDALVLQEEDNQDLRRKGCHDRISSLIVINGQWTLYRHTEFGGTRWHVQQQGGPEGDGTYPHFNDWNGDNDQISSVRRGHQN